MDGDMQHFIEFCHIAADYIHTKLSKRPYRYRLADQLLTGSGTKIVQKKKLNANKTN